MFIGLNYCNVDYVIGRYNANLYIEKNIDTVSAFSGLSLSATKPLLEIQNYNYNAEYMIDKYERRINRNKKWQSFNIARYKAYNRLIPYM